MFQIQLDNARFLDLPLLADAGNSLFQRLDEIQRAGVLSALAVVLVAAGFLVLFTFACGRITRWYINRKSRFADQDMVQHEVELSADRKPRPRSKEYQRWQQPH